MRFLSGKNDAPDSSALVISARMIQRHFVMRDDAIVKIRDIERTVGAKLQIARPKPRIVAFHEIGFLMSDRRAAVMR